MRKGIDRRWEGMVRLVTGWEGNGKEEKGMGWDGEVRKGKEKYRNKWTLNDVISKP